MSESFLIGEVARLSLSVADIAGAIADPGGVVLRVKSGSAAITAYTYGADATIVRDSLGNYHADLVLASPGQWAYRWELSAPNTGAAEGLFLVQKSYVI